MRIAPIPPDSPQHSAAVATKAVLKPAILSDGIDLIGGGECDTILQILYHRFQSSGEPQILLEGNI